MKKFLHLAAPLRNVGDNALILGMRELFKEYVLQLKPIRRTVITTKLIASINSKYAGLIIGGGGLLHAPPSIRKRKHHSSGTLIMLNTKNLKFLTKPLIVYGVGYNVFRGERNLPPIARRSIIDMIDKSVHFSVRNDGSRQRLSEFLGIHPDTIEEVPDPGLYVGHTDSQLSNNIRGKNIAIQIAADRLKCRFNGRKEVDVFVENIKHFIESNQEYKCWLVPHCPIDDKFIKKRFKGYNKVPLLLKLEKAEVIMGFYKKMDVVIGQRGHGNICPFGIGVPIISLVSHDKNFGFMKSLGLEKYAVPASEPKLSFVLTDLVKTINEDYIENQTKIIKDLEDRSRMAINSIVEEI
tara:strand:+ start:7112 stop:8167 length:1056 start_codon:yes stop_codon:yes gene_type:complete